MRPRDEGATYYTAKAIFQVLAGRLSEMPQVFRRSDAAQELRLTTSRENALLTDALHMLQQKRLVEWNGSKSGWTNLVR